MSLKQVDFNYELNKEHSTIVLYADCQQTCGKSYVMEAPVEDIFCGDCSEAVLQLKDSALVAQSCSVANKKTIVGHIVNKVRLVDAAGCPLPIYKITFEYDDTQLSAPNAPIEICDIEAFSCFTAAEGHLQSIMLCAMTLDITVELIEPCPSGYFVDEGD